MKLPAQALTWFANRKIGEKTLDRWPVHSATVAFGGLGKREAVVFSYLKNGETVNWKARCIAEKAFTQKSGGEQRLWNIDRVLAGNLGDIYITEGETDALALAECGYPDDSIIGFGQGAPGGDNGPSGESKRYQPMLDALAAGLAKAHRFVLLTDNDDAGRRLRADLVAVLGAAKCRTVDFPKGVKDVNEALIAWGAEDVRHYITEAQKEWPIVGLYRLGDLPTPPALTLWEPPFKSWRGKLRIAPTMVSVLTGFPGAGKSLWSQFFWFEIARAYNLRVALFSAETPARPHVVRSLREFFHGCRERDMTDRQKLVADEWIAEHFYFIQHPNSRPTFPWALDMLEAAKFRYGCRVGILDPWNKLESDYDAKEKSETQWIGECLDQALDAARALDMHLQITAHPAKPNAEQRKAPPDLYSISGSANWFNRVDQGFAIHRPKFVTADGRRETGAQLHHLKVRFPDLGWICTLGLRYNTTTGRYEDQNAEPEPKEPDQGNLGIG